MNTIMTKYIPRCSCIICKEEKSSKGIFTHYLIAHTDYKEKHKDITKHALIESAKTNARNTKNRRVQYDNNPTLCKECNNTISYDKRINKFCSHSCSATAQNKSTIGTIKIEPTTAKQSRIYKMVAYHATYCRLYRCKSCNTNHQSIDSQKICGKAHRPITVRKTKKSIRIDKRTICGPFSKLCYCRCKYCGIRFFSKSPLQYCNEHRIEVANKRAFYKFRFNVYDYPELFDLHRLTEVGFYGPGGKSKRWNKSGLSRDHKVSVSDAIQYNYDRYYISHPMNCELMPHTLNDKKKGNSSITYDELRKLVIDFDLLTGGS